MRILVIIRSIKLDEFFSSQQILSKSFVYKTHPLWAATFAYKSR